MSFAKTLLSGAALCALCAAPALAAKAPAFHLVSTGFDSPSKVTHVSSAHVKTSPGNPDVIAETLTYSFSAALSSPSDYRVPIQFAQYTWQNTVHCVPPKNQTFTVPRKTDAAKIAVGTTTGATSACPSATFTFSGALYDLIDRHAKSDSFQAVLFAKKYFGYNLKLIENWDVSISRG